MSSKRAREDSDHSIKRELSVRTLPMFDHSAFFSRNAAAAAATEPASKKANTAHLDYNKLVRHASSVANWQEKFEDAKILVPTPKDTDFSRSSKRVAALFRFLRQLATKRQATTIKDLFRFVRCRIRFANSVMEPNEDKDMEAMTAGSDEDNVMIKVVEECVKKVGYFMLRALVDIRAVGSKTAQGMGLYAIICCNDTLQDYINLVHSHYCITRLYLQKAFASLPVFQHQITDQASHLKKFMTLGYLAPSDLLQEDLNPYRAKYEPAMYEDETEMETLLLKGYGEWPDYIRFARMVKQSIQHVPEKSGKPQQKAAAAAKETDAEKKIRVDSENTQLAELKNNGLRALNVQLERGSLFEFEFDLDRTLDAGTPLYSTANQILQNFATALKISGIPKTFAVLQAGFSRRVMTIECIMLQFCFDKLPGRTDARKDMLRYCSDRLRESLDLVVVSAVKGL
jgi:hypothetical protein